MALPRSVKVKRALLVSLAAKFLAEAAGVRAAANENEALRKAHSSRGNEKKESL